MRTLQVNFAAVMLLVASLSYGQDNGTMNHDNHEMEMGEMHMTSSEIPKFKDKEITAAYKQYNAIKSAIFQSKGDLVREEAKKLITSLEKLEGGEAVHKAANELAASSSPDSRKAAFSELSSKMASFLEAGKLAEDQLYLAHCPMANNNSGGFWIHHEKEVINPFFGGKMLKCGSIKETIN